MAAAEARGELHHARPVGAEDELRVRGPVRSSRAPRPPRARPSTAGSTSCALGQTWASATPNAGGSAVSRSVTVSGWKRPSSENGVHGHLGPGHVAPRRARRRRATPSSAVSIALGELVRADGRASARAGPGGRAALTTQGSGRPASRRVERPRALRDARLGERARAAAPSTSVSAAVAGVDRMREADPLGDPRGDGHGPVDARARRSRRPSRRARAGRPPPRPPTRRRRAVGEREARRPAGRGRRRSRRGPALPGGPSSPSWAGPAPRTRRRCRRRARGRPATRPRCRDTTRPCARARPRTTFAPASRVSRSALSVEPM